MHVYLLLYQSLHDLTNALGRNLISVFSLTDSLGRRLISALVLTSHLKYHTIFLILLCLAAPFLTAPGCFCLAYIYTDTHTHIIFIFIYILAKVRTYPVVQAEACSIRLCLWRSHEWLCSIRSRLWCSHHRFINPRCAPYPLQKSLTKEKISFHGNQTCTLQLVSCMHNQHSTLDIHL